MLTVFKISRGLCAFSIPLPKDMKKLFPLLHSHKDRHHQILQTMAQLYNPHRDSQFFTDLRKKQLKTELEKYRGIRGRRQKVASLAWVIVKLDLVKECREMLDEMVESITKDQWYVNFDEAVKAMEAFTWIPDDQLREDLYEKIERNVGLTIWEVNMSYYFRLTEALVKARRLDSNLWSKLEYHILNNLSMDYSTKLILDTFLNFALAGKGSAQLYYALQQTIYKGHLFQKPYFLQGRVQHSYSSQLVSTLFKTFGLCSSFQGMRIDPDFAKYLMKVLSHRQFVLEELIDVVGILQNLKSFEYGQEIQGEIRARLFSQIKEIQGFVNLPEVIAFYERLSYLGMDIPKQVVGDISVQCLRSILYGPRRVDQALEVYSYLQRHGLTGNELFVPLVEQWLEREAKYFDKEELKQLVGTMAAFNKKIESRDTNILIVGENQQAPRNLIS